VSEELRVSSSIGHWLDWRLGGFYTHESTTGVGTFNAADLNTGAIAGTFYGSDNTITFSEYAVFGDVTAHITDRFDVGLGGRESWNHQVFNEVDFGPAVGVFDGAPSPNTLPTERADGSAFTYQVTPRFKISPDVMVYARVASGYRIGGPNSDAFKPAYQGFGIPSNYAPDRTTNYEVGVKGDLFERQLSFDVAVYYIDWKNFQITVMKPFFLGTQEVIPSYTANAGNAKSEGIELSLTAHPMQGLTITAEGTYDDAVLTQNLPAASTAYGPKGDRLPYSMRVSGGFSVNQDIHLTNEWVGFLGGSVNYVGSRPYEFTSSATQSRVLFPGYTQLNLRAGARYDSWQTNLYVNNVADKRGIAGMLPGYGVGVTGGYYATIIQPRTVGLSISRTF
jgi:iron complex outermembrane receptor protein